LQEYKTFLKKIGLLGITTILVSLNPLILLPILTQNLTTLEYGVWVQYTITITIIPAIAVLGLPYTMVRFLSPHQSRGEIQEVFYSVGFTVVLGSLLMAIIFLLSSTFLAKNLFNGNMFAAVFLPISIFLNGLILLFFDFFRTFQEMKKYSLFSLAQAYIAVILVAVLVLTGGGINSAIMGLVISQLILIFAMYILILRKIGFKIPLFSNLREYLNFGLPTIPTNLSFWILDITDRYLIGLFLGLSFVSYYSAAYLLGNIISLIMSPFYTLLLPNLALYHAQGRIGKIRTLLNYSIKLFLILSIPLFFLISILSQPILKVLSTQEIAFGGYFITPILALGGIFFGLYGIMSQVIILERKTRITGNIWIICAVSNLVMDITFGFYWGIMGIALTSLLVYIFAFTITLYYSYNYIRPHLYGWFLVKSIFTGTIMSLILIILNPQKPLDIILASILALSFYYLILWRLGGIQEKELIFFRDFLMDIRLAITQSVHTLSNYIKH